MRRRGRFFSLVALLPWLGAAAPARDDVMTLSTAPLPPPGYTAVPYANPYAPKGGAITVSTVGDFDQLNPFILRGTPPPSIYRVWQPLFKASDTDSVTAYAELARAVNVAGDKVTFFLDPRARFSDGTRVTSADVVWTFNTLITQGLPFFAGYYAGVASVAAPDDGTVVFTMKPGAGRDLPSNLAGMYILPAHFWKGRNFVDPLRVPPVGSGPYQVSAVSFGNAITYTRVKNWWAGTLPADKGFYNFDTYTEQFFQTDAVALQAFKAGQIDARVETSAKQWATAYGFPAARDGRVKLALVPETLPAGIYGLAMNTRRATLADPRVRQALTLAFDFEWMNRVLFHGAYTREHSFFSNSILASAGLPSAAELQLLAPFRGHVPDAVFTTPLCAASDRRLRLQPAATGSGDEAAQRRRLAGEELQAGEPRRAADELGDFAGPAAVRAHRHPYAADLKLLGIDATVRTIDVATYQRRMQNFDYDMTQTILPESDFPGTEQSDYWSCAAAAAPGANKPDRRVRTAIDAMVAAQMAAPNAASKAAAIRALDGCC